MGDRGTDGTVGAGSRWPRAVPKRRRTARPARSLAVHGMVTLGLEQKLIAVPVEALRAEIALIAQVRAMVLALRGG